MTNCFRPYWRCYYANTDALVYVIDSVDKDRLGTARAELAAMLQVKQGRNERFSYCLGGGIEGYLLAGTGK